jgi:holliday junction DNA helicase RuvA
MIYGLKGTVVGKGGNFAAVGVGGVVYKVFMDGKTLASLPLGEEASLFSHLHVKEDALDLYGFRTEEALEFFELLISVSGVGPKSALSVLEIGDLDHLTAAIQEGRPDLLTQASGIGRKTGERIILELRNKVRAREGAVIIEKMEGDADLVEALVGLGYRKDVVKAALDKIGPDPADLQGRLKIALKFLSKK